MYRAGHDYSYAYQKQLNVQKPGTANIIKCMIIIYGVINSIKHKHTSIEGMVTCTYRGVYLKIITKRHIAMHTILFLSSVKWFYSLVP